MSVLCVAVHFSADDPMWMTIQHRKHKEEQHSGAEEQTTHAAATFPGSDFQVPSPTAGMEAPVFSLKEVGTSLAILICVCVMGGEERGMWECASGLHARLYRDGLGGLEG